MKKWILGAISLVMTFGIGFGVVQTRYALEWSELRGRWDLHWEGVQEKHLGPFAAYYREGCPTPEEMRAQSKPFSPNCTCLVMIHGAGDQALTWKKVLLQESATWVHPVRLWAIDLPGSGRTPSTATDGDLRVRSLGRILGNAMKADALASSCTAWGVIGNSLGGWIAAWTQLEHPQSFQKLLLVDSSGLDVQIKRWLEPTGSHGAEPSLFDGSVEGLREFQKRAYHSPRALPEFVWKQAAERMKRSSVPAFRAAQSREDALDTYLPSLRAQTFVFWGKSDRITLPEEGREFARLIPGAILREAPSCGHLPQKECPQALIKVINDLVFFGKM